MPALIGLNGEAAFAQLDTIEEAFAMSLIADVAAAIDAGDIPQGTAYPHGQLIASIDGTALPADALLLDAIDVSLAVAPS